MYTIAATHPEVWAICGTYVRPQAGRPKGVKNGQGKSRLRTKRERKAIVRVKGTRDKGRLEQMVALRSAGQTLEDIGAQFGITRERARQLITANAPEASRPDFAGDPIAILSAARHPDARSLWHVTRATGTAPQVVQRCVGALGVRPALNRLYRWRKWRDRETTREAFLAKMRAFIEREGRLPYSYEMGARAGHPKLPELPGIQYAKSLFGSSTKMWAALGVTPRARGRPVTGRNGVTEKSVNKPLDGSRYHAIMHPCRH